MTGALVLLLAVVAAACWYFDFLRKAEPWEQDPR